MKHENETPGDNEICFFYHVLEKWSVLNLTEGYAVFQKDIKHHRPVVLPLLIHHKDDVVEVLLKHLRFKNHLYLQPLLE